MQGSFSEIYVIDCATLRFLHVNRAAQENLQYAAHEFMDMTPMDIAQNLTVGILQQLVRPLLDGHVKCVTKDAAHVRKDGTAYPLELWLSYCASDAPVFIAIGNDTSARHQSAEALLVSEARFRAIVSNTPGLVYQFLLADDGSVSFPYLSDGCHALLGVTSAKLRADSSLFLDLILPEDRQSYLDSMAASAESMKAWNWEGRIRVEKWNDIKWINLRSTPRALPGEGVQWEGIMTNITQSKRGQAEIERSRAQLAELSAHVETVKEKERMRIARELHDDLGGNLTAIKMSLALIARHRGADETVLAEKLQYVDSLVDRTIEAVHRISADLRPSILDLGIVAAIKWQAREFEKQLGIPCEVSTNKKEVELDSDYATALFRIFQEALTNIGKHAKATKVGVHLARSNRSISLEVTDNGRGIAATDRLKPKSFGIRGMEERANALGGRLNVASAADGGTVVTIKIPLTAS
ncbi:MAG: two-component system, NarL family, sensor histidine kinase UhpB [Burkholderiales bacterium]